MSCDVQWTAMFGVEHNVAASHAALVALPTGQYVIVSLVSCSGPHRSADARKWRR